MINNETDGKPKAMSYNMNPKGGTDPDSRKPGSGASSGTTRYNLKNPEVYYRVSGGPTLGTPSGGPEENISTRTSKPMTRSSAPNMKTPNSGRNTG